MLIAVDTNVLFDEEFEDDDVPDALATIRERLGNPKIVVPPTVLHELAYAVQKGEEPEASAAASILTSLLDRGYEPLNLIPAGHGIVEQIGMKIRIAGLLPDEEVHDSYIIAESALIGSSILLSSDWHMVDAQGNGGLHRVLEDCSVHGDKMIIARPRDIVRKFMQRR